MMNKTRLALCTLTTLLIMITTAAALDIELRYEGQKVDEFASFLIKTDNVTFSQNKFISDDWNVTVYHPVWAHNGFRKLNNIPDNIKDISFSDNSKIKRDSLIETFIATRWEQIDNTSYYNTTLEPYNEDAFTWNEGVNLTLVFSFVMHPFQTVDWFSQYIDPTSTSSCGTLSTKNGYYNLTTDISYDSSYDTCFTIGDDNITIACNGHFIEYDLYGVYNPQYPDISIKDCNITQIQGTPTWASGKTGGALDFDGDNDYVLVPNHADLELVANSTFGAWILWQGASGDGNARPILFGGDDGSNKGMVLHYQRNTDHLRYGPMGLCPGKTNAGLGDGNWHYVVGAYRTDTDNVTLYIDGEEVYSIDTATCGPGAVTGEPFTIGARNVAGTITNPFDGLIDQAHVYNRTLGAAEILANNNTGNITSETQLIAFWQFEENIGISINDTMGIHNGTLHGSYRPSAHALFWNNEAADNGHIVNNTIFTGGDYAAAVKVYRADNINITSNHISSLGEGGGYNIGFIFDGDATYNLLNNIVSYNTFSTSGDAMRFIRADESENMLVYGNNFSSTGATAQFMSYSVDSSETFVHDNVFNSVGGYFAYFSDTDCTNNSLYNNTLNVGARLYSDNSNYENWFVNNSGLNKSNIDLNGAATNLTVGWILEINVTNSTNGRIPNASVLIVNAGNVTNLTANTTGFFAPIVVWQGLWGNPANITYETNLTGSHPNYQSNNSIVNVTKTTSIQLVLGAGGVSDIPTVSSFYADQYVVEPSETTYVRAVFTINETISNVSSAWVEILESGTRNNYTMTRDSQNHYSYAFTRVIQQQYFMKQLFANSTQGNLTTYTHGFSIEVFSVPSAGGGGPTQPPPPTPDENVSVEPDKVGLDTVDIVKGAAGLLGLVVLFALFLIILKKST